MKQDFHMDVYNKNLKLAYAPEASLADKKRILNYFLAYKSEVIIHSDCPKKVEDVILYLKGCLNIPSDNKNTYGHPLRNPIIGAVIAGLFVLIIWQYISTYFS
ncbi:hypothetical protein G3495_21045 [Shewanella baltica]|uniref:hypothetical protein n=1 Tax=Shewanella baltica TaxID=62322 RepID=UPI00217CDA6E|nr:hypothetical protein [Shewanella baltica]MCS6125056.1 hypothetical protein [Shewanella baltica]MCS6237574.1 hypothetical protein [Shewanella baltica]MCS6261634.1 hypothetical protein [Shewanella baltica]MCS6272151.1 hypothetical protein [Shewanella baltica]